ncbi:NucA/NucB deoxyribonuclease domain-containing protein [Micromonospora sp. CA-259024]|uniref:NucA/NucB deoxyribonuclease domain-containing protein n=1 Tax=Micromonospora sp. CA-259024 TaxID=3239965 RepID=UPI003D93DBD2
MRRRINAFAVCAAIAAITGIWAPTASAATGDSHGRLLDTVGVAAARPAVPATVPLPAASGEKCTPAPAKTNFCVRTDPSAFRGGGQVSVLDGATCAVTGPVEMRYQRFGSCLKTAVTGTLVNDKGVPIGTGTLSMVHSITLSATSSAFEEQTTVTLSNVTGQVTQVAVSLAASCTSGCVATKSSPWTGAKVLSRGQSASGTINYSETLAKGAVDNTRTKYNAFITVPNATPVQPNASWDGVTDIRCDNAVGNFAGCVYPGARPDFEVSLNLYGAAAVTYYWAQIALPDGWGSDTPLRRLASDSLADANRRSTCDSTFVPFPDELVVDDSCDEYPFAKTYEGGTPGGLCADIVPLLEDGQWQIYEANPNKPVTGTEKCVRGHVPLAENEGAGGELGRFTQAQRVLDLDPYSVTLVD